MTPQPGAPSADRTRAKVVVGLTLACTVLSLYDVYLMAAGF